MSFLYNGSESREILRFQETPKSEGSLPEGLEGGPRGPGMWLVAGAHLRMGVSYGTSPRWGKPSRKELLWWLWF